MPDPSPGPKDTGEGPTVARTLSGTIRWDLTFDDAAIAAGHADCHYTRTYDDFTERTDIGWLCPDCSPLTQGLSVMTEGHDDCYAQLYDGAVEQTEQLGLSGDGGELWWSNDDNIALGDVASGSGGAWTWTQTTALAATGDTASAGNVTVAATATLTLGVGTTTVEDPAGARTTPYRCGWPEFSPGGPVQGWSAALGATFPNARLRDVCGEGVDLWDFRGRYVVVDAASTNCGPCQNLASMEEAFKTEMAAQCVDVEVVTLLNASLGAVNRSPDDLTLRQWTTIFHVKSPVLADADFGYVVLAPALNPDGGMSLPSIAVLNPNGVVVYLGTGFGEATGYFDTIKAAILSDLDTGS